jgi:hypothetical protein
MNNIKSILIIKPIHPKPIAKKCDCGTQTYARDSVCSWCRVRDRALKKILAISR